MKSTRTVLAVAVASAMALSLSACGKHQAPSTTAPAPSSTAAAAASSAAQQPAPVPTATTGPAASSTAPMSTSSSAIAKMFGSATTNWFGGPIYSGKPDLDATAALVKAGGGAKDFKFSTALVSMLGKKNVDAEVAKLNKQYGKKKTDDFINGMTFAVKDALKRATEAGVKLPTPPADLHGTALAKRLVQDGTAPDGTFWAGYFFDHTITHKLHNQVMGDIDAKESHVADGEVHLMLNQAMYDVAQKLGDTDVKLAPFH